MRLLRAAAADGHTALGLGPVVAATDAAAVRAAARSGLVVVAADWVALPELAHAEEAVAEEVKRRAVRNLAVLILGNPGPRADAVVLTDLHRTSVVDLAAELQGVPHDLRLVLAGDPDELPGQSPGAVLRDLLAWGVLPVHDQRGAPGPDASALGRLTVALRRGQLVEPHITDRSLIVVVADSDAAVAARAVQVVTDSVPRVLAADPAEVLVVSALNRGVAGVRALAEALPTRTAVCSIHEAAWQGRSAPVVVACFPGQAAGVLSRALVYSTAALATRSLCVVTGAAAALPHAVARGSRPRHTRLLSLLRAGGGTG